jgi:hypothetical protein
VSTFTGGEEIMARLIAIAVILAMLLGGMSDGGF